MKRWGFLLGLCLAIQAALAVSVNLARTDYATFKPAETLLSFDAKMVDGIHIEQGDKQQVELTKKEGTWRVFQLNNFQADQDKVENFLNTLAALKKGWPVATTTAAAKRFKVAENSFERKIKLSKAGKNIDTLYVGTSPGFRKIHARGKDEDAVYAVNFNDYEAGAKPEDWIDKGVLKHQESEISRVQLSDFSLYRQKENLVVEGMDEEAEETVAEEAQRLLRRIADLRINSVVGTEATPAYNQGTPVLSYTLELSSGESEKYLFSKPKDADYYVLKPSHRNEYFKVDTWVVDDIKKTGRSKLVRKKDVDNRALIDDEGSETIETSNLRNG